MRQVSFTMRLFVRFFGAMSASASFAVAMIWLFGRVLGAPWEHLALALTAAIAASAVAATLWTLRFARQSSEFAAAVSCSAVNRASENKLSLLGSPFEEVAAAWQLSLEELQTAYYDRHAAARRNHFALVEMMRMVAKAADERTNYLRGHSERVAAYAEKIAREMQLDSSTAERIHLAALIHDIGTIGIADAITSKSSGLSPEEFEVMKAHTVKGAAILRSIEPLHDLIPGVELHHEALDGSGYPFGLKGDEIPLMPRIIAVADTFDAMTTARPYQNAMESGYVVEVLNRLSGTRYDREVVQALIRLVERGDIVVKLQRAPVEFRVPRPLAEVG